MEESIREQDRESIRAACAQVPLIDAHAHNVVTLDSNLPFLHCFSEARGHEALSFVPHSLSFQRSVQDLAGLYGCEPTLAAIEQYRQSAGLATISEKCFDAANIEFVLLDDGLTMDKMVSMGWHRKYIPGVHRVLRIETVAEAILNQVQGWLGIASESPCWILCRSGYQSPSSGSGTSMFNWAELNSGGGWQTQGIQVNMGWTLESFDRRFVATLESYPCAEIHNRKKESHLLVTSIKQPTIVEFCKLKPVIIPHHVEKMPFLQ
jgi:hypothetical protein